MTSYFAEAIDKLAEEENPKWFLLTARTISTKLSCEEIVELLKRIMNMPMLHIAWFLGEDETFRALIAIVKRTRYALVDNYIKKTEIPGTYYTDTKRYYMDADCLKSIGAPQYIVDYARARQDSFPMTWLSP